MSDEREKTAISKVNKTEADTSIGPVYIVTVKEDYTEAEMSEIAELACALPQNVIGAVMVVREGTHFSPIYNGPE